MNNLEKNYRQLSRICDQSTMIGEKEKLIDASNYIEGKKRDFEVKNAEGDESKTNPKIQSRHR